MLAGNLTIKTQLILAVTVPCLALLLVGAASLRSMDNIRQQAEELFQNTATPMRAMAEVASRIPRMRVGIDMMRPWSRPSRPRSIPTPGPGPRPCSINSPGWSGRS